MCRIFGISYGEQREDLTAAEIASILFPSLVHGGPHAWGWMSYNDETEAITSDKYTGRADTIDAEKIQMDLIDSRPRWLVGHVRFATHGSPEDNRNNHPLQHGNIIGVHNGILRNHDEILKITGREDPKTLVDSEAIMAAVNKWGPKQGLARIRGDMVTLYSDHRKPHILHLGRTHGRQITLGWTKKGNLIFASEEKALHELEPWIEFTKFSTVSENRLLVIRAGQIIQRITFAPPVQRYIPPPASVIRKPVQEAPMIPVPSREDDLRKYLEERRAQRRGEILFGKRGKKKKGKRQHPIEDSFDGHDAATLHYYDGQLLTDEEYALVMEREG